MKTKDVPAIVMLLAGGVYCVIGIRYQIPLMQFTLQLLAVLIMFWIFGGIVRMVLDKFMVVMADKEENKDEETGEHAEGEDSLDAEMNADSSEMDE